MNVLSAGTAIATLTDPFTPALAGVPRAVPPLEPFSPWGVATAPAVLGLGLLALQLGLLQRRGRGLPRPALAGLGALVFYWWSVLPALAQLPDGDLNGDRRLDAGDAVRLQRIVSGELQNPPGSDLIRGDVAPLETAPNGQVNAGDVVLLLRAIGGEDVDADGLPANVELDAGASPFRLDSDRDGLSDALEIELFTHPALADTDGDGITDPNEDTDGDGLVDSADPAPRSGVVYRHADHLGSGVLLTKASGTGEGIVLQRVIYRPFGGVVATPTNATAPEFGYTGQRFEASVGIYDYGARWYDPVLARFLQPDSMVPDPGNPQSLNRYTYVLNNPISLVDPTGNFSISGLFGGVASFASTVFSPIRNFATGFASSVGYNLGITPPPSGYGVGFGTGAALGSALGFLGGVGIQGLATPLRVGGAAIGSLPVVGGLGHPFSAIGDRLGNFGGGLAGRSLDAARADSRAATWASNLSWGLPNTAVGLAYAGLNATLGTALSPLPGISRPSFGIGSPAGESSTTGRFLSVEGGLHDLARRWSAAVSLGGVVTFGRGEAHSPFDAYGHGVLTGPHESGHVEQSAILGPFYLPAVLLSYGAQASRSAPGILGATWIEQDASMRGALQR